MAKQVSNKSDFVVLVLVVVADVVVVIVVIVIFPVDPRYLPLNCCQNLVTNSLYIVDLKFVWDVRWVCGWMGWLTKSFSCQL